MASDAIVLRGLKAMGVHGVLAEEKARAQPFEVDLQIELDLRAAGSSDDLDATLDYGAVCGRVAQIIETEHHALLERLAERIAGAVLADERITSVTVEVRKLRPPVPHDLDTAGVRLTRP